MRWTIRSAGTALFVCLLAACDTTKSITLYCQERHVEIYVDGEYLGRDQVQYTVPKGRDIIEISGKDNGMEIYHRELNVRRLRGNLIEIQIPKNYRYSDKPF